METLLSLEEDCFLEQFGEQAPIYARFDYYRCSKPNLVYRLKPHTDGAGIDMVLQDKEVKGLHVLEDDLAERIQATHITSHIQEVAFHCPEPPSRYVHKDGPINASSSSLIPIIDIQHILSASATSKEREEEMEKLRSALASWGMFQMIGHGIPNSLLDEVRELATEFFYLPMEQKKRYSVCSGTSMDDIQGYGDVRSLSEERSLDWSDRLYLLVKPQEQRKLSVWPEDPKRFREVLHEYSIKSSLLADNIVKTMSKLLSLKEDCFLDQFGEQAPIYARFNYYPHCSKPDLVYGIKPHTDGGGITLLLQDKEVEGLHILKDGEWIKVPVIPHALVVNIADQMEIMSNGMFKSPVHRVVPDSEKDRLSLALFYSPHFSKEIGPPDALIEKCGQRLFKKVTVKDYVKIFVERFWQGKSAIDYAKV